MLRFKGFGSHDLGLGCGHCRDVFWVWGRLCQDNVPPERRAIQGQYSTFLTCISSYGALSRWRAGLWFLAGFEGLDDAHLATAIGAWPRAHQKAVWHKRPILFCAGGRDMPRNAQMPCIGPPLGWTMRTKGVCNLQRVPWHADRSVRSHPGYVRTGWQHCVASWSRHGCSAPSWSAWCGRAGPE